MIKKSRFFALLLIPILIFGAVPSGLIYANAPQTLEVATTTSSAILLGEEPNFEDEINSVTVPDADTPLGPDLKLAPPGLRAITPFGAAAEESSLSADTITVNKTAEPVEGCRTYQVTLSINGVPNTRPSDVVIAIDVSGSMNSHDDNGKMRLDFAKEAAIQLATSLIQANAGHRVALVKYSGSNGGDYDADSALVLGFTSDIDTFTDMTNTLQAGGWTNTQAGYLRSREVAQSGNASAEKAIVFLTDGLPTISIGGTYVDFGETDANRSAAIAAGVLAAASADLYTVGLYTNMSLVNKAKAALVLTPTGYKDYYTTDSAADLSGIYNQIASNIGSSSTDAIVTDIIGSNFDYIPGSSVTTPPAPITYDGGTRTLTWNPGSIGTSATFTYKVKAKDSLVGGDNVPYPTNELAVVSYTNTDGLPSQTQSFPIPTVLVPIKLAVSVGPDLIILQGDSIAIGSAAQVVGGYPRNTEPRYDYLWTNDQDTNWSSTELNPLVTPLVDTIFTLTATDKFGCKKSDSLTVFVRGSITLSKDVTNENTTKAFAIWVTGPLNPDGSPTPDTKQWATWIKEDETPIIKPLKAGLYTIKEVVPMNYKLVSITGEVTLTMADMHHEALIVNERSNYSWFTDEDERVNIFSQFL